MVEANRSLPHYWVDMILTTTSEASQEDEPMTPQEDSKPGRTRREGNITHIRTEFATRLRFAIIWQAQRAARKIVVRELKAKGIRTSLMSTNKLTRLTIDYLCRHRAELLAQAEASGVVQHLGQTISQRPVDPQAELLCECPVRNGEPASAGKGTSALPSLRGTGGQP